MVHQPHGFRVVFVQNGDFRASDHRIRRGIGETYDAQKYSMEVVERIAPEASLTAVLCINAEEPHDEVLESGVRSIGLENIWRQRRPFEEVVARLEELMPTHLILRLPSTRILEWARRRGVRVFPCFADSFTPRTGLLGLRDRLKTRRLAAALNHSSVRFVGNHNVAAAEALADIGVNPAKIVPWDWPRSPTPTDYPVKAAPRSGRKKLIFVGTVSEAKGVGDILHALAVDTGMGEGATLDVLGGGDIDDMRMLATKLGVAERVRFAGRVAHPEVVPAMHDADAVIVYSRHAYGEGLPGTIYLALASRTPLVISDHPMFVAYLRGGIDVMMVPENAPEALAAKLSALFRDAALYETLSRNSAAAFERIAHPVHWGEVVERWLRDASEDHDWLKARTLPVWREG